MGRAISSVGCRNISEGWLPSSSTTRSGSTGILSLANEKASRFKAMSPDQQKLAHRLLVTGLSSRGAQKALDIMYLDHILFELQRRAIRDTDRYYVTVFGEPSTSGDWGWRVEGHHLSLNFSIRNGRLASASPLFMGSNPAIVQDGPHKGMQTLAEEELMGRELLHTLADRSKVLIQAEAPEDIITRASRRAEIGIPQGVTLSSLEAGQKDLLMRLITIYAISASARDRRGRDGTHQQEGNGFHSLRLGR